jgi:glycogen debranching enzyme
MALAPELFMPSHAKRCLHIVEQVLMSPTAMGIKTLDPTDRNYNGNYVNSDASNGHNYH